MLLTGRVGQSAPRASQVLGSQILGLQNPWGSQTLGLSSPEASKLLGSQILGFPNPLAPKSLLVEARFNFCNGSQQRQG